MGLKYLLTQSTEHLKLPAVKVARKRFPDGELSIQILESVKGSELIYLSNITADNLLEFLFLFDAAIRSGAKIRKIIIPYLGYARQDKVYSPGEALSVAVIGKILKSLKVPIEIYDVHSEGIKRYFPFQSKSFLPQLASYVPLDHFVIISPDQGGIKRAKEIAKILKVPMMSLKKTRLKEKMLIQGVVDVRGRNILIVEDVISTGTTLQKAASFLKKKGASDIYVIATHGVFTKGSYEKLASDSIKRIYISNSFKTKPNKKIKVCPCL